MSALPVTSPVTSPTKPEAVTVELNVAAPAPDISKVRAVIVEPPSLPCILMSLSDTADLIIKSVESLVNLPNSVPPSFNIISAPSASKLISPALSKVIVEPSISSIVGVVKVLFVNV